MSKCWYCNNELTSGDSPKHFGICNKCYDKMFKSGDTIIRSLTNKIAELKQQLAEEKEYTQQYRKECAKIQTDYYELKEQLQEQIDYKDEYYHYWQETKKELAKENKQLKQQLAEKEQEIESLKDNWNILCDYLGNCVVKYDEEDINGIYSEVLEKANKLKKYDTSIAKTQNQKALEQLKKVKAELVKLGQDYSLNLCDIKIYNFIDNQINELKGKAK